MMEYVNPVKIIVLLTFIAFLFVFDKGKKVHVLLMVILSVSLANEILSSALRSQHLPIKLSSSCFVFVNNLLWLWLLATISGRKKLIACAMLLFAVFATYNLAFVYGAAKFHTHTFIAGAFLYVVLFIYDSFTQLRKEDLTYFSANDYILLASPLLFFIGFSILFGFDNKPLHETMLYGRKLFEIVCYFINFVYYLQVITYIFKERKIRDATQ